MQSTENSSIDLTYRYVKSGKVAILALKGDQQNLLQKDFIRNMSLQLTRVHHDSSVKGIILTSGWSHKFSSGPDIKGLTRPHSIHFRILYDSFRDLYIQAFRSPIPLIAAINGDCPSFACALVMACDERVMAHGLPFEEKETVMLDTTMIKHANSGEEDAEVLTPCEINRDQGTSHTKTYKKQYTIGFPEPIISMTTPRWIVQQMVHVIGPKYTEYQLRYGASWTAQQAYNIGLVDHVCTHSDLMKAALRRIQAHVQIRNKVWQTAKYSLRGNMLLGLNDNSQRHVSRVLFRNHFMRLRNEIQSRVLSRC